MRCVTWGTVRTFAALLALTTGFACLAWFMCLASLLWGLLVLSCCTVVGVFGRTFFTWGAVATLAAVTAVTVA
jgi:hypothetical protein